MMLLLKFQVFVQNFYKKVVSDVVSRNFVTKEAVSIGLQR